MCIKYSAYKIPIEKCFVNITRQYGPHDPSGHMFSLDVPTTINLINQAGFHILNKSNAEPPNELWDGKRFNRFGIISPLFRFIANFLQNNTLEVYEWIFGTSLFVFCKNK